AWAGKAALAAPREMGLALILAALFVAVAWRSPAFLQTANLRNLGSDAALLSFCAIGATLVLLAGGIDISLGALIALSASIAGWLWERGASWPVVALLAVSLGGAGGFLNAALSLAGRVHPIVVTLGTMSLYRGLAIWWLRHDVQIPLASRADLLQQVGGLPLIAWLGVLTTLATWMVMRQTVWGREVYALGSNPAAARQVGIGKTRVWCMAFTVQGTFAGLAGFLYLASSAGIQPGTSFDDKTLEAIAAAVVGGVAITGGRGSVWGAALGCLFLTSLTKACQ